MKRLLVLVLAMVMSGCASIPLGTMLEFRSFGKDEFLSIQPEVVRVRMQLDEPVRADIESTELTMALTYAQGSRTFSFPLVLVDETTMAPTTGYSPGLLAKLSTSFNSPMRELRTLSPPSKRLQKLNLRASIFL